MSDCPFCRVAAGEVDEDLVAWRSERVFVLPALKQRAANRGHALVLPTQHVIDLEGATPDLLGELFGVVARVSAAMPRALGAVGTTVFQNNSAPDQVLPHLHVHVVPRFAGDAFHMPDPTATVVDPITRATQASSLARALRSAP